MRMMTAMTMMTLKMMSMMMKTVMIIATWTSSTSSTTGGVTSRELEPVFGAEAGFDWTGSPTDMYLDVTSRSKWVGEAD